MKRSFDARRNNPPSRVAGLPAPARVLLGLALGYLRWVSLTPMVVVWAFYLFMIVFMVYVNFEGSFWDGLERGYEVYRERIGPIAWIEENQQRYEAQQSTRDIDPVHQERVNFTLDDVMPWIMQVWGFIALAAWLMSLGRHLVLGPRPPRTLACKLRILMVAVAVGWALLFVAYFLGNTAYHGSFWGWFALYTGSAFVVTLVSVPILALSQLFDFLDDRLGPDPMRL